MMSHLADAVTLDITIPHKICHSHTETLGHPMEGAES
jgi:hypothetical protein